MGKSVSLGEISKIMYSDSNGSTVELSYTDMKGNEYFESLRKSVVITEEMVNSGELIGTTTCLSL